MSKSRGDVLTEAVDLVDLPQLIEERYPQSGARAGQGGTIFASWRGNENTKAVSLTKKQRWLWHDFATDEGGSAYDWLTMIEGMGGQEAAHLLIERVGLASAASPEGRKQASEDKAAHRYRPLPTEATEALAALPVGTVPVMRNRGFTPKLLEHYGIKADGEDALIPITSPEGLVVQVKRRLANVEGSGKYRYEHKGYGGPAWCSLGLRKAKLIFVIEGELSAIIAHAALEHAGLTDIGVMGMAGAASPLYPGVVSNKAVYIYADDDEAGHKAKAVWAKAAHDEGARSVYETVSHSMDFCEYAGSQGKHALEALAAMLVALRDSATQVYGAVDRVIGGNQSIREIIEETRQLAEGKVIHTTGFSDVDRATGGIREAGLYGVAGLSAMGKSVAIRRMLLANLRDSDKSVRVYSPDQGDKSMWRLIASQLSGVSWSDEVRSGNYSKESLALYGSPKDAKEAWFDTYQDVLIHISPRFQVSPERHMGAIAKDMERAVAEGVTMFAADYLQVMTPSLGDKDGDQADEMQALSMRLGVPVLVALQLAKSKYPPTRVSGIPVPSDIEGSGAYYQSAEMMFMVYNEGVYGSKYAGDRWQPENDPVNMARLRIVKDKEGSGDGEWPMSWWPRLATYTDYIAGSPTYDVKRERKGLLPT